jgi:DNA-binding NtrC family response regulator
MSVAQPVNDSLSVLIIEDEPDLAAILKRIVEAAGPWKARLLTDPTGLDAALETLPDLVFTDLVMPGLDGFEVIRRVRARDADLPVIVVSAHASLENAVRAVREGAFDFLAKPFKPESVELILAKTERDRFMRGLHDAYPHYGFDRHMGYGTAAHLDALKAHGACPQHRRSFAPVKLVLDQAALF